VTKRPTVVYAGTYERDYPRNRQLIRLLRRSGCQVIEVHAPFWETDRDKSGLVSGRKQMIGKLARLFLVYLRLLARLIPKLRSCDAIVVGYIGQIDMLVIGPIAWLFRRPILFNPLVTLSDTMIEDRELASPNSALGRVVALVDRAALTIPSLILSDTVENAEYMTGRFAIPRRRIRVLHVGADEEIFRPGDRSSRSADSLQVLFYGKMIPLHGVETILEAIEILHRAGDDDIKFEIIGSGQQQYLVESFLRCVPGAPVTWRRWVAFNRLPQRIAASDCVLGIFDSGPKAGRVIPNKVFQAMAAGAPIITRDSSAIRRVLEDNVSGQLTPPADPDALAEAIRRMRDAEFRAALGAGARAAFERFGSDDSLRVEIDAAIAELLPDRSIGAPVWRSR
jgi:glycosyltransferase involved in cell wall biosynthesis